MLIENRFKKNLKVVWVLNKYIDKNQLIKNENGYKNYISQNMIKVKCFISFVIFSLISFKA